MKVKLGRAQKRTKNNSFLLMLGFILVLTVSLIGCAPVNQQTDGVKEPLDNEQAEGEKKLLIYTTVYPVHFFAQEIAGERAVVKSIIPVGAEPHDFEPTAKDIMSLSQADLFVYNGGGFESWIEKIVDSVNNDQMILVDTTANISLLTNAETGHVHDDHDHGHGDEAHGAHEEDHDHDHGEEVQGVHEEGDHDHHDHGDLDPHVWLDPQLAKQQAEAIKDALIEADPEHIAYYEKNFEQLTHRFMELDDAFAQLSEHKEREDFIVSHAAYGYLANRYGLNQVSISGLSPSSEPSPRQLQEIIEYAKEHKIEYILFENMVSTKVAEVVRESIGAEALVLHNLEVLTEEEISQGQDFFSLMHHNVEVLKKALGYK